MEYEDFLKDIGDFGPFQRRQLAIVFLPVLFASFSGPISVFLAGDQDFRCKNAFPWNGTTTFNTSITYETMNTHLNDSIQTPVERKGNRDQCHTISINGSRTMCDKWDFDTSVFENTFVSQFDLVCENKILKSHAVSAFFIGSSCSVIVMTCLADMFGRRIIACVSVTLMFVANIVMPFSTSIQMVTVTRFMDGFFGSGVYMTTFVISLELMSASKRIIAGTAILLVYCTGEFILVLLAYFIRDWRWLQLTVGVPMIIQLIYWWPKVLPESVRWLITRGRIKEALFILRRAAKVNGRQLSTNPHISRDKTVSNLKILRQILSSRRLLVYWGIASSNWFVVSFIYYGITLNLDKLGGNIYASFAFSTLAETIGSFLLFFMDKLGHKRLHMIAMFCTCVVCIASIFPLLFAGPSTQWLTLLFAMLGKCSVSTAFGMVYVYTGEIFPTVTRTFAIGSCNFFARVASLCSPYLYDIAEGSFKNVLPLILYAVLITVVTLLAALLPETTKQTLPDKIEDTEKFNMASRGMSVPTENPDQTDDRT